MQLSLGEFVLILGHMAKSTGDILNPGDILTPFLSPGDNFATKQHHQQAFVVWLFQSLIPALILSTPTLHGSRHKNKVIEEVDSVLGSGTYLVMCHIRNEIPIGQYTSFRNYMELNHGIDEKDDQSAWKQLQSVVEKKLNLPNIQQSVVNYCKSKLTYYLKSKLENHNYVFDYAVKAAYVAKALTEM
jgi:hypothetical protein